MSQSDGGFGTGDRSSLATLLSLTPALCVSLQCGWEQNMFLLLDAFRQRGVVIAGKYWNCRLSKDRSSIKVGSDDMHRAATDRDPRLEGLPHSIKASETGQ